MLHIFYFFFFFKVQTQQAFSASLTSSVQSSSATFTQWNSTWRQQLPQFLLNIQNVYKRGLDLLTILNSTRVLIYFLFFLFLSLKILLSENQPKQLNVSYFSKKSTFSDTWYYPSYVCHVSIFTVSIRHIGS